jgi:two-component system phosphate regulon response regulator PhoB
LQRVGHLAAIADDAEQAWALMSVVLPDLILLNRMLPRTEGGSFARQLRENMHTRNVPFIMLGACKNERRDLYERYSDLDDCVARPSQQEELISRVAAVLRQRQIPRLTDEAVSINGLSLEPSSRKVLMSAHGAKLVLHVGPTELRLLYFFMTHPDRVYSRTDLLEAIFSTNGQSTLTSSGFEPRFDLELATI